MASFVMRVARFLSVAVLAVGAQQGQAESYRMVPGDRVLMTYSAQGVSSEVTVNIDGELRLLGIGGVKVVGDTLDEAEARLGEKIAAEGVFLDPKVSLQVLSYAPVIVSGDVTSPGQYPYIPGMTIASALALAGGSEFSGVNRYELERARIETTGAIRAINLEIAGSVLRIARLEALLAGQSEIVVSDALNARIPAPNAVAMDQLRDAEEGLFVTTSQLVTEALDNYDQEIELLGRQLALFENRIAVQQDIVTTTARELKKAQDLQTRGLQTATRLASVEQRDADARARVLELEAARIGAVQALAEAHRARNLFESRRREGWLEELQTARLSLSDSEIDYARRLEHQAALSGNVVSAIMASELLTPEFQIVSSREGREAETTSDLSDILLPGELLIVRLQHSGN
ncbi:polysaccharide biosynthesis/export family protein [Shimia sp. MMG029]|uniref:polysaccharide biosynthesis/export family protein n=1 Tax=Shimia sp. MMG029 TaxID=3021978 RepID=UPI0022FEC4B5|nr:polysaccharide biosynthesis/export family protein [Shimia sp. MMG029]MDA5558138.1 polysaccharide biosynthesis/export family protein [Shimia sp. MMG029]